MPFTETYSDTFDFAGYVVEVECETLPGEAEAGLRDLVRKDDYGRAEVVLLGAAIKRLTVGGESIIKPQNRAARRGVVNNTQNSSNLPPIYDRETWESLTDRLLRFVVAHEFWLVMKEPLADVFARHAPDDLLEERDPTPFPDETSSDS